MSAVSWFLLECIKWFLYGTSFLGVIRVLAEVGITL